MNPETKNYIDTEIREHIHDGNYSQRVNSFDVFAKVFAIPVYPATIATTGNTDSYTIAPVSGNIVSVDFSGTSALAASDANYITFSITNLGQAGSGTAAVLTSSDTNTTKSTGGSALSANTRRQLSITRTPNDALVVEGDRLLLRAAATGTLANTVTFPVFLIRISD